MYTLRYLLVSGAALVLFSAQAFEAGTASGAFSSAHAAEGYEKTGTDVGSEADHQSADALGEDELEGAETPDAPDSPDAIEGLEVEEEHEVDGGPQGVEGFEGGEPVTEDFQEVYEKQPSPAPGLQRDSTGVEEAERGGPGKTGPYGAPFEVEPLFVRRLTELSPGRNDSNPVWSPAGDMIAFERNQGSKKEIHIVRADGTPVNKVYYRLQEGEGVFDFFLPGIEEDVSYNAGVSWAPGGDRFVFMSNAATGNYDIYVRELASRTTVRLTEHAGKDGHAQWSPTTGLLVFVSGRSGKADLYLLDQVTNETVRLSYGEKSYLYPQWSPDGTKVAMIYGSNENHDIQLIEDLSKPKKSVKSLTTWRHDDLRPIWSPDGKKIAFYTNYNLKDDPKLWSIAVIEADGSGPTEGEGLAARVVAKNVVPDMELGPAWLPDSARIAYVKDELKRFNPIYIVNVVNKSERVLKTGTKMNHDVSCSSGGILAFRAQVEQWDHIYLAKPGDAVD